MDSRLPKFVFALLVLYAGAHFAYYYPQLPATVASHFDFRGDPNGWQTKQAFFVVLGSVTVLVSFVSFGVPKLISMIPNEFINLPNKEYWLAPERRAASLEFLGTSFAWFGCALLAVLIIAFAYAVQSNLRPAHRPNPAELLYVLIAFGAFVLAWTIRMMVRFAKIPSSH